MDEKCSKCNGSLTKVDTMNSGNSRYDVYECQECSIRTTKCSGLVDQNV